MNKIKIMLDEKNIEYPTNYLDYVEDNYIEEASYNLDLEIEINKDKKYKIYKSIENKSKLGNTFYIKGYPVKNYKRHGYNHYVTTICDREYTLIECGENFGAIIPKHRLEKIINNIYINYNSLSEADKIDFLIKKNEEGYTYKDKIYFDRKIGLLNFIKLNLELLYYLDKDVNKSYYRFEIPKRRGGYRTIEAPNYELKKIQRLIVELILKNIDISSSSTAFAEGSSIKHNAKKHINKKYVLNIDLKDFFNNITENMVFNVFKEVKLSHKEVVKYSKLCTNDGQLPQGAPSSPYISNIVCKNLDKRLGSLCKKIDANYTRYADDITISSNDVRIKKYRKSIENIIEEEGFYINIKKVRLLSNNSKQIVTGIVVNEKMNVDKNYIRKIRQEIYYSTKYGVNQHLKHSKKDIIDEKYLNHLQGKITYIKSINLIQGEKLQNELNKMKNIIE